MRLFCIGRNYVAHAEELKNAIPDDPVVFIKPDSALSRVAFPAAVGQVHFEGELVLRLGENRQPEHMTVGLDFTARDLQSTLKTKGLPWELSKGFDGSAVLGDWIPFQEGTIHYTLEKNGDVAQSGDTDLLIFKFETIIEFLSRFFELRPGDVIFTGTPAGVGPCKTGDSFVGKIEGREVLNFVVH
jgi:2-keto-4-pentenoate hydratase/2-oxohepta-3-ene-1,7-dioic acid hydratase in catechol pathway